MTKNHITAAEFNHFLKKYFASCIQVGEECSMLSREEVRDIIVGNVKRVLQKELNYNQTQKKKIKNPYLG